MSDAIVVGGGPAGAAIAIRLAVAGRDVRLIERSAGPVDKVCGEFISGEAARELEELGVDLWACGAVEIHTVRFCFADQLVAAALPFRALSLSRRVLDEALLERAAGVGATLQRGVKVSALSRSDGGWVARMATGADLAGDSAFLATGKHDLRSHKRPLGVQDDLVAFKLHWRLAPDEAAKLAGHVELVVFDGGYAGLQPVESGRANLCLVIRRRRLLALGQRWDRVLAAMLSESSHLAARLAGAEPCWRRPLALSAIPYGYVRQHTDGLWQLGDQAAVIPSFSGDGMAIALHSSSLAASMFLRGSDANEYQARLARDVGWQVRLATMLSRALVRRPGQLALGVAATLWPGLLGQVATHTRVADHALAHARAQRSWP